MVDRSTFGQIVDQYVTMFGGKTREMKTYSQHIEGDDGYATFTYGGNTALDEKDMHFVRVDGKWLFDNC